MRREAESAENNGCISFLKLQPRKVSQTAGSKSMNQDQGSRESRYATAVLAAAFAIHSHEEAKNKANGQQVEQHSNIAWRRSYNKTKSAGRSSSFGSKPAVDLLEKVERHEKLNSILAWANGKKMKAKSEKTKM
ncbi:hypothetical protein AB3S75_024212 [Citrus x aurantiifolia]